MTQEVIESRDALKFPPGKQNKYKIQVPEEEKTSLCDVCYQEFRKLKYVFPYYRFILPTFSNSVLASPSGPNKKVNQENFNEARQTNGSQLSSSHKHIQAGIAQGFLEIF